MGELTMKIKFTIFALLLGLSTGVLSFAHHSFSSTYLATEVELKDVTIVDVTWANPHTIVLFDATDETGQTAQWVTETGSPSALTRIGWTRNAVSPGDVVTVAVNPARDGTRRGHLVLMQLPDGRVFDRRGTER
jgi:hypothetical protein